MRNLAQPQTPMTEATSSSVSPKPTRRARVLSRRPSRDKIRGQPLTGREIEILGFVTKGLSNKSIADRLDLSAHTVKFHLRNATQKIGTSSRTKAAVDFALQQKNTASATAVAKSDSAGDTRCQADESDAAKRSWINGFAVALAQVHREGGGSTVVYEAARDAGLTLTAAHEAGVSSFDIRELKRAKIP